MGIMVLWKEYQMLRYFDFVIIVELEEILY